MIIVLDTNGIRLDCGLLAKNNNLAINKCNKYILY